MWGSVWGYEKVWVEGWGNVLRCGVGEMKCEERCGEGMGVWREL